ncbi:MAG: phosphopantothenoylcysteine decarboxylase [Candidatus Omnitrophota bacterium]|nr:phosphopantothenoylcysteine decarboxylase [Candidatus Omnitrophota bacterium]
MTPPKVVLITSGPTWEFIDPVRFISNPSTGRIGYELAREAVSRNFRVILISGPTRLIPPKNVRFISVVTTLEMRKTVGRFFKQADCLIMAAAVSDYRAANPRTQKIKIKQPMSLKLVRNPDILQKMSKNKGKRILVGFALETRDLVKNARLKLDKKGLDFIVANKTDIRQMPFGNNKISCVIIDKFGNEKKLKNISKRKLAGVIFDKIDTITQRHSAA